MALCFIVVDINKRLLSGLVVVLMPYLVARKCEGDLPERWGPLHELPRESRVVGEKEKEGGGEAENMLVSFARWAAQNGCALEQGLLDGVDAAPSVMKPGVSSSPESSLQIAAVGPAGQWPGHTTSSHRESSNYVVGCSTCCKGNKGAKRPLGCVPRFGNNMVNGLLVRSPRTN